MAVTNLAPMFGETSGAVTKIHKKSQHAQDERMILLTHRTAATSSKKGCQRVYLRTLKNVSRTTPLQTKEIAIRNRFRTVAAMVLERKDDLSHVTSDQAAFMAQKDLANGKKTMKAYLWSVCGAEYDAQNG